MNRVICALLVLLGAESHAQIGEIYTLPYDVTHPEDHIVSQNGTITAEPFINDIPQLFLRHLGKESISNSVSYDVGIYTGFHTDSDYQYGEFDSGAPVGTSAIQLEGTSAGCMINTFQFNYIKVAGGGPHCAYQYKYDTSSASAPRPWSTAGESLTFQFFHKLPQFYRRAPKQPNKAIGQSSMVVYLRSDNGQVIGVVANIYDMRGKYPATVAHDGYSVYVSAPLENKSASSESCQFFSKSKYSASHTSTPFKDERFFRMHITEDNLDCIIQAGNSAGLDLPKDRSSWAVDSWLWLMEIGGYSATANASLGGSIRDPYLLTCTDVNC